MEQKIGGVIALLVAILVGVFVCVNLRTPVRPDARSQPDGTAASPQQNTPGGDPDLPAGFENPIGEPEERNQMKIAAVWLPPIQMEGMNLPQDPDVIHLEADIHALEGNVHRWGLGAWVPYLKVQYEIIAANLDATAIRGSMDPMVAKDGPHYGATIRMPGPGKYRLIYTIEPPSAGGMGRHSDPVTGVPPWWEPFDVEFEFDYPGGRKVFGGGDARR